MIAGRPGRGPLQWRRKAAYLPASKEYGLIVHDGGTSYVAIRFCPWCGVRLSYS